MTIFDKTAVEAALPHLLGTGNCSEEAVRVAFTAALSAAIASMRERAVIEDVIGYDLPGRQIISIRKETP